MTGNISYIQAEAGNTARNIARTAQRQIKSKTGVNVTFMLTDTRDIDKTPEFMLNIIAVAIGLNPRCYKEKSRVRQVVELRFIGAMFLRTYFPDVTLQQIASCFGGLDHSSIISGLARGYNLLYTNDPSFTKKYNAAQQAVNLWRKNGEVSPKYDAIN